MQGHTRAGRRDGDTHTLRNKQQDARLPTRETCTD